MIVYERIAPEDRCVSPDGHEYVDLMTMRSAVPDDSVCPNCGKSWTIVTFDDEATD